MIQPKKQVIDREAVKTLAIAIGVREAARKLGLNENTVRQWSRRFKWFPKPQPITLSPRANESRAVTSVTKPSEALATLLEADNRATKLNLSKGAAKASKLFGEAPGAFTVKRSRNFKDIVGAAAQIHGWDKEQGGGEGILGGLQVFSNQTVIQVNPVSSKSADDV